MTVGDLISVIDVNGDRNDIVNIMDGNGEYIVKAMTKSVVWEAVRDMEIECLEAEDSEINIWIKGDDYD